MRPPTELDARRALAEQTRSASVAARELAAQMAAALRVAGREVYGPVLSGRAGPGPWARGMFDAVAARREQRPGGRERLLCEHLARAGARPAVVATTVARMLTCRRCSGAMLAARFQSEEPGQCDGCEMVRSRGRRLVVVLAVAGPVIAAGALCSGCLHVEQCHVLGTAPD